jgi:bifunctional enzyme CysN/CysC
MENNNTDLLRVVIVGHVDHGKSTLVGRLVYETGSLPDGKYEAIRAMSERRGMPFEWAFLMDAMQAERDQGITIDTTQIWLRTRGRDTVIIDAPGHKEFLKNMITGAAQADAAVLVIDAAEGVKEQSRRHGYLLHLMGLRQVAVAVNKMDLVAFSEVRFRAVEHEVRAYLQELGITPSQIIPISAKDGDLISTPSSNMTWYRGGSVVGALETFQCVRPSADLPLRLPVQDVYKFDDRRIVAGRIECGTIRTGDRVIFSPSNKTATVASIEQWSSRAAPRPNEAKAGQSIGITLAEPIFVERGDVISHEVNPPIQTDVFRARIFWLGKEPLVKGRSLKLKMGSMEAPVQVQTIERIIDTDDLKHSKADAVQRHQVAEITLRARRVLALDEYTKSPRTGRFVLVDKYDIAGGGLISMDGYADQRRLIVNRSTNITRFEAYVSADARSLRNGHKGGVVWLTGLSGAGKSTIAVVLEERLFEKGYQTTILDGDNVRHGLNSNLAFSPEDRAENIRRVGEVAALFAKAGLIVITSFISPYRSDRDRARRAAGNGFHEIFLTADVATCEARDPKGLYKKARAGEILEFTGVSAPYEQPEEPELTIDTAKLSIDESVALLSDYIVRNFKV